MAISTLLAGTWHFSFAKPNFQQESVTAETQRLGLGWYLKSEYKSLE